MTQISYVLDNSENVSLNVYNASGKLVKNLVSEVQSSGAKTIDFDTSALSNGVYFYTLRTATFSARYNIGRRFSQLC
jgi:hypothetical protein